MTVNEQNQARLGTEDRQLVDLVTSALVDPDIHTDVRMRLSEEITEILRYAHREPHRPAAHGGHQRSVNAPEQPLPADSNAVPDLLAQVLVDPTLHTDTRMHLHEQISRLLRDADILA
jgi:hypothetical protein